MNAIGRLEALAAARRAKPGGMFFDTSRDPAFDRLTHLVTHALEVPVSLLSIVEGRRVFYKSAVGVDQAQQGRRSFDLDQSLCRHVVASGTRLVINDARNDRRLSGRRSVVDLNIVAYAGVPVRAPDGRVIATLAAIDDAPRNWEARDADILDGLARCVETEFALRDWLTTSEAARRQADELAETRRAIIAMCNHELRNPLNGIVGGVALLKRGTDERTRENTIKLIEDAGHVMLDIIEKVLTTDSDNGVDNPAVEEVDLRTLLNHRVELARHAVKTKDIEVDLIVEDAVPATLRSNGLLLQRIVGNLVDNAVKYTDKGEINVKAERQGKTIIVRVSDTGRGIDAADVDRIFERYERADAQNIYGLGLGLAIAREAAQALEGDVYLDESTPGCGSTFVCSIPIND